jgi:hypothetical protein
MHLRKDRKDRNFVATQVDKIILNDNEIVNQILDTSGHYAAQEKQKQEQEAHRVRALDIDTDKTV